MGVEYPEFVSQPAVEVELAGVRGKDGRPTTRKVEMYAISLPVLARLIKHLGAPVARAIDGLATGKDRQDAIGGLVEALGAQPHLVSLFVLDALQAPGDDGAKAMPAAKDCDAFLAGTPAPAMAQLFAGALRANKEGFAPFFAAAVDAAVQVAREVLARAVETRQEPASESGSAS